MKKQGRTDERKKVFKKGLEGFVVLEALLLLSLVYMFSAPLVTNVYAAVGSPNATVTAVLQVGQVSPEVLNVTINDEALSIDLTPNDTVTVNVYAIVRDFNGEGDIANVTGQFFDNIASSYGGADDNNNHYSNNSCYIDPSYGDVYTSSANCTFEVYYYANNQSWNGTILVADNASTTGFGSDDIAVNALLALGLPDTIDYGEVNATDVSDEIIANVTNYGNVMVNLSLSGYGATIGDGLAMNCSLGVVQNISIHYEKFNITTGGAGPVDLVSVGANYTNLSSSSTIYDFGLAQRQSDVSAFLDDTNATYWRIYVPTGVAGNCTGNIVFGAVRSPAT